MSAVMTHGGLPSGFKPFDTLDMLSRLRTRLGLKDQDIAYLRHAFCNVRGEDFMAGRICAIWHQVAHLADKLSVNVRQINRTERRLESLGFIRRTSGPSRLRSGKRDSDNRVVYARGVNLGPLIDRVAELQGLDRAVYMDTERLRADRDRANDLIRQIRELGADDALAAARQAFPRLRPSEVQDVHRLGEIVDALEAILEDFSKIGGRTETTAGSDSSTRPDTKIKRKIKTCTPAPEPTTTSAAQVILLASDRLREAIDLYGSAFDPGRPPGWEAIAAAAREIAMCHGVSGCDWQRSCDQMGAYRASLCLVIADRNAARNDSYQVRNVASAFQGMVRKEAREAGVLTSLFAEITAFSKRREMADSSLEREAAR